MNKGIIFAVVGVVIVGGGAWYAMQNMSDNQGSVSPETTREAGTGKATGKTSMKSLIDAGIAQKCTFTETVSNSSSSGTVYVGNGNMRGDFTSVAAGKTINSHMIVTSNTSFVWDEATGTGMKMPVSNLQGPSSNVGQGDINKEINYSCEPWNIESSKFTPPSNISFTDITAMMDGMPKMPSGM